MSPKGKGSRAGSGSVRKSAAPKGRSSPKASPMQKAPEPAHGPNVGGHDAQAQAAHVVDGNEVAPPNTPPAPPAVVVVDEGQR